MGRETALTSHRQSWTKLPSRRTIATYSCPNESDYNFWEDREFFFSKVVTSLDEDEDGEEVLAKGLGEIEVRLLHEQDRAILKWIHEADLYLEVFSWDDRLLYGGLAGLR